MERRKIVQNEVNDENGLLKYTIIPNYKLKENFITDNEYTLYEVLKKIAYDLKLRLFTQVALNRIIEVNNQRKKQQLMNRIDKKSIDFVLYNEETKKIECCIELDDETHNKNERKERDIFLDEMFKDIVKLIHIKRQKYYNKEEIRKQIQNS